jgi:hypothetical protein
MDGPIGAVEVHAIEGQILSDPASERRGRYSSNTKIDRLPAVLANPTLFLV